MTYAIFELLKGSSATSHVVWASDPSNQKRSCLPPVGLEANGDAGGGEGSGISR